MLNKGDRFLVQKNYQNLKYGDIVTFLDNLKGNTYMIRHEDNVIGVDKSLLRKATIDDLKNKDVQKIVNPNYLNGKMYVVTEQDTVDGIDVGDIGFIVGVDIKENENEDIFTLDFGMQILKFDKNFMDNYTKEYIF
jgi:hypothetical protein